LSFASFLSNGDSYHVVTQRLYYVQHIVNIHAAGLAGEGKGNVWVPQWR